MNRNMMRQAQKQLAQLQKIQEELETLTVEGSAGGGAVKVVMTGKQIVESVTIEPEAAEEVHVPGPLCVRDEELYGVPSHLTRHMDRAIGEARRPRA